jgi:hypothetical protein
MPPERARPPSLAETQRWLRWILTDPRGVRAALADPRPEDPERDFGGPRERYTEPVASCLRWIVDQPPLERAARLDIYAEAYFARLQGALEKDFPALAALLGDDRFRLLCAEYLERYPSSSPNLSDLGSRLPAFLAARPLESAPWGADLARLEWALIESFYARPAPSEGSGGLAALAEMGPEQWPFAKLALDPSVRLVRSEHPLHSLWKRREAAKEEGPGLIVIHRSGERVELEPVDPMRFAVLSLAAEGKPLGEILEALEGEPPVMSWFVDWVERGLIRGVVKPSPA